MTDQDHGSYYVPEQSAWPILATIGLSCLGLGTIHLFNSQYFGPIIFGIGALLTAFTVFGWFRSVVKESRAGLYDSQMFRTFRWGMRWFLFAELMLFGGFLGALLYVRIWTLPWLSGSGHFALTNLLLWPDFQAAWPLLKTPDPSQYAGAKQAIHIWGIPAFNSLLFLVSVISLKLAHRALNQNRRTLLNLGVFITLILGIAFVILQAHQLVYLSRNYGLTITGGIYGSTFFMLIGLHLAHVLIAVLALLAIFIRCLANHFTADDHFGFAATAWFWYFLAAIWLVLFIVVYWV